MKYRAVFKNNNGKTYEHYYNTDKESMISPVFDHIIYDLNCNMKGTFKLTSLVLID